MKKNTLTILFVFTVLCFSNTNLLGQSKTEIAEKTTVKSNAIPADFDFNETLVIALRGFNFYDKPVQKITSKNYQGKVVFVKSAELEANRDKYRYFLEFTITRYTKDNNLPGNEGKQYDLDYYQYYIFDSKTGEKYLQGTTHYNWDRLFEGYMVNLELERVKNI